MFAAVPVAFLAGLWLDSYWRTTVLFYDLDAQVAETYRQFVDAFEEMGKCEKVWHISAEGRIVDVTTWKRNAGADNLVRRSRTPLTLKLPPIVRCNLDPPHVRVGRQELFFFPGFVLVLDGNNAGAIPYDQLNIHTQSTRFIEEQRVPSDAEVVGHTWQHPNKSGGPDRRFSWNRQIPVCLYEEVLLTSQTGLQEIIQLSRTGAADAFVSVAATLGEYASAKTDEGVHGLSDEARPDPNHASSFVNNVTGIAAAILIALGTTIAAGWTWQQFARNQVALTAPAAVTTGSTESKPKAVGSAQPATNITTGTVAKRVPDHVPSRTPTAPLEVAISISVEGGNRPVIVGRTNLPTGTQLIVTLSRKESAYTAQSKAIVAGANFRAGPFSQKDSPLKSGKYRVDVSSSLPSLQPAPVRAVIGKQGENLRGAATNIAYGERVIDFSETIAVGSTVALAKDAKSRAQTKQDRHAAWAANCKSRCERLRRAAEGRNEVFDGSRCYLHCLADEPRN